MHRSDRHRRRRPVGRVTELGGQGRHHVEQWRGVVAVDGQLDEAVKRPDRPRLAAGFGRERIVVEADGEAQLRPGRLRDLAERRLVASQ